MDNPETQHDPLPTQEPRPRLIVRKSAVMVQLSLPRPSSRERRERREERRERNERRERRDIKERKERREIKEKR